MGYMTAEPGDRRRPERGSHAGQVNESALLDHISRLPHGKANLKQMIRELGARISNRQELETLLARRAGTRLPQRGETAS